MEEKPQEESNELEDNKDTEKSGVKQEDRKMYPATCSKCGKDCEVPFEPIEGKAVKCKDCYQKGRTRRFNNNRGFKREMHDATCSKCGKDCQVPFKPNGKKPIFCKECYVK